MSIRSDYSAEKESVPHLKEASSSLAEQMRTIASMVASLQSEERRLLALLIGVGLLPSNNTKEPNISEEDKDWPLVELVKDTEIKVRTFLISFERITNILEKELS